MRFASKVDENHAEIREAAKKMGAGWCDVFRLPNCCDAFMTYAGVTIAIEIKDGSKVLSKRKLTTGETKFSEAWVATGGKFAVIESIDQLRTLMTSMRAE